MARGYFDSCASKGGNATSVHFFCLAALHEKIPLVFICALNSCSLTSWLDEANVFLRLLFDRESDEIATQQCGIIIFDNERLSAFTIGCSLEPGPFSRRHSLFERLAQDTFTRLATC